MAALGAAARDRIQIILRHDYNSASMTKDQPSPQQQLPLVKLGSFDSRQNFIEGNEADTETAPNERYRKRRNSTIVRASLNNIKSAISPITATARQSPLLPNTPEGLTSPTIQLDQSPSYFTLRPSNSNESRSPGIKRPPASRSSHGVATSTGPPPAISTQRAFSFDIQQDPPSSHFVESPTYTPKVSAEQSFTGRGNLNRVIGQSAASDHTQLNRGRSIEPKAIASHRAKAVDPTTQGVTDFMMDRRKRYSVDGGRTGTYRLNTQLNDANLALQDAASNGSSHEDLFLNMAQVAVGEQGEQEQKSRPSNRFSLSKSSAVDRPTTTHERRSSLARPDVTSAYRTPQSDRVISRDRAYASTAHPLEGHYTSRISQVSPVVAKRNEALGQSPGERKTETPSRHHSRYLSAQLPTPTNISQASPSNGRHYSFDQESPVPIPRTTEGTESTVSTTAPSTVWDELDDLKSRIRKLEFTGKLPPSSSGSMERPRTAATSATTMSSSPKRNGMKSASPTTSGFDEKLPYPLLTSALTKVKGAVSPETYRALEVTATDAMNLAKITFNGSNPTTLERQLKRKADNMCRSLTELCIALAAANTNQSERPPTRARSSSRDVLALRNLPSPQQQQPIADAMEDRRFERSQSLDPEPTNSQRVLSRLEARRTSMRFDAMNSPVAQGSPQTELHTELRTPTQSMVTRTNTVLQRRRLAEGFDNEDQDTTIRPLSRANTDLARANTTSAIDRERNRMSREYTSKHPLPNPFTRNFPGVSNASSPRRSYMTNGVIAAGPSATGSNNSSNSTISAQTQREKDLPTTPATPGFGHRRYLTRIMNTGGVDEATSTATSAPAVRSVEPRQRMVSSSQHNTARSYLSTRAGDRRSFVEASSGGDQAVGGQI